MQVIEATGPGARDRLSEAEAMLRVRFANEEKYNLRLNRIRESGAGIDR